MEYVAQVPFTKKRNTNFMFLRTFVEKQIPFLAILCKKRSYLLWDRSFLGKYEESVVQLVNNVSFAHTLRGNYAKQSIPSLRKVLKIDRN